MHIKSSIYVYVYHLANPRYLFSTAAGLDRADLVAKKLAQALPRARQGGKARGLTRREVALQASIESGALEDALLLDWGIAVKAVMLEAPSSEALATAVQASDAQTVAATWSCPVRASHAHAFRRLTMPGT